MSDFFRPYIPKGEVGLLARGLEKATQSDSFNEDEWDSLMAWWEIFAAKSEEIETQTKTAEIRRMRLEQRKRLELQPLRIRPPQDNSVSDEAAKGLSSMINPPKPTE